MLSGLSKLVNMTMVTVTGLSVAINPVFMEIANGPPKDLKEPKTLKYFYLQKKYCDAWFIDTDTCSYWRFKYNAAAYHERKDQIPLEDLEEDVSEMGKP